MAGFRHVVLFRWNADATEEQKQAAQDRLNTLPGVIPELRAYSCGGDAGINPGNADFAVVADFADRDAYLVYRDHPVHRRIVDEYLTPIVAERYAVQYEL